MNFKASNFLEIISTTATSYDNMPQVYTMIYYAIHQKYDKYHSY